MSGENVLFSLRKEKQTPVIAFTLKDHLNDKGGLLKNSADEHITKPFNIEEVPAWGEVQMRRRNQKETAVFFPIKK